MKITPQNIRVMIIETPYMSLRHSSIAREMIGKLVGVRLNAYLKDYKQDVFPLGTEDFISHHVAICVESDKGFEPIYSFKIVTMDACEKFSIKHPLIDKLEARYGAQELHENIKEFIASRKFKKKKLAYLGSRSKSVEIEWTKEASILVFNVGLMSLVKSIGHFGIDEFTLFGMLNNDAYKYCEMMGMEKIVPAPVIVDSLSEGEAYVLHLEKFSKSALEVSQKFISYWDTRIHVTEDAVIEESTRRTA